MSRVGLVVVSHSAKLADGVVEVAAQMAPDVTVVAAGGLPGGGIGTDFDAVDAAITRADGGAGVVVLYDLGSARMIAETALEARDEPAAELVDAPLVEGAVAAAVAAQGGAPLADVAGAARAAAGEPPEAARPAGEAAETRVRLANDVGLHARPAALLARTLSEVDAQVTVRLGDATADGRSVLALMGLGARKGDELVVAATGAQATEALRKVEDLVARNFDEGEAER
ncbi:MAG TPA: dihydroxyacetone kinase phosphoryl donor subunit DhaM [Actinophytocola sp.]|uniref:dihydroxyacetone kinase phosphoryl donor subunit DhaM n=1 Tax=Actinophytocola sp. TaxID=1872138 RepID=UPI002F9371EA